LFDSGEDCATDKLGDLRDYGVSVCFDGTLTPSVQVAGKPINHATHGGFSFPPTCITNGSDPTAFGERLAPANVRPSLRIGVGHSLAACAKFKPKPFPVWCLPFARVSAFT
jgi:hypothetical protein